MNEFEKRLAREQWRPIPPEWRQEILQAGANAKALERPPESSTWWHVLFWPVPRAWAAFAGLWIILGIASATMPSVDPPAMVVSAPGTAAMAEARREQQQLAAELFSSAHRNHSVTPAQPRPRSERKFEDYFA